MEARRRGRPTRGDSWVTRRYHPVEQRFRLGVPVDGAPEADHLQPPPGSLEEAHLEFCARYHRHMRRLALGVARAHALAILRGVAMPEACTPFEEDCNHAAAEAAALHEMRALQRNRGQWLVRMKAGQELGRGGRPRKSHDLLSRAEKLRGRSDRRITLRSTARILATLSGESHHAVEAQLRRAMKTQTKPTQ